MLIVICGATATGKSSLGLRLASRLNTVIINADSRIIYQELDIGTAKPTKEDQLVVPHYMIDIKSPRENLTLAEYQEQAQKLINANSLSLLVGGTGLYIKAIVQGLKIPRVSPQPELRLQLAGLGQRYIYDILSRVDSQSAGKIHPNDQLRTIRALEVFYVTGVPISEQQGENPPSYPILQIGLECDSDTLDRRIQRRTQDMLDAGLVAEVETLVAKYGSNLALLDTLGYAEIKQYLEGKISLTEAKELIILHTRQFAKRQRTWFRADETIEWFPCDGESLWELVWERVQKFLRQFPG